MSKLTLEFDLPTEQDEAGIATSSGALCAAIHDYDELLRRKIKDGPDDPYHQALYAARSWLLDELEERNVLHIVMP